MIEKVFLSVYLSIIVRDGKSQNVSIVSNGDQKNWSNHWSVRERERRDIFNLVSSLSCLDAKNIASTLKGPQVYYVVLWGKSPHWGIRVSHVDTLWEGKNSPFDFEKQINS